MRFNVVSLFSGCGGLDKGFELAGPFKVVWANDIYEPACRSFSKNFGLEIVRESAFGKVFCGDVEDADFSTIITRQGIDVVIGGPPCQDFSLIRGSEKRRGVLVKRGRLYVHFIRALVTLQPKAFVFENVKGLMSANEGEAFSQILKDFANLNLRWPEMWHNHKKIVDAVKKSNKIKNYEILFSSVVGFSKIGVPQERERVIVIGIRKDLADQIDFYEAKKKAVEALTGGDDLMTASFPLTPIEAFQGKPLIELEDVYRNIMLEYKEVQRSIHSLKSDQYFSTVWDRMNFEIWHDYLVTNGLSPIINDKVKEKVTKRHEEILKELGYYCKPLHKQYFEDGSNNQIFLEQEHVKLRMSFIPPGENHEFVRGTDYEVAGLMSNIYKRIHPLRPSPTVIARGGGGTWGYHYKREKQRLTNRERARLQTFPDNFLFEGTPTEVRRQIGEAVPPLASKRIANIILKILEKLNN